MRARIDQFVLFGVLQQLAERGVAVVLLTELRLLPLHRLLYRGAVQDLVPALQRDRGIEQLIGG